ncbi:PTS glucitol/sorbitol transporter subunit IIA [Mammaliicoccus sciuri]|jgi:PTS system glucitol/sorbitol-specific IIA component|uniref:PTS glucitol/sorbitol transporter subunit IIA n=1 Tax=Mammaliicoccus sciuri TaxID=1296 RepID=UPI0007349D12|nr:PTS glucitol/sorbitol transporter subunit IIA [Mammaliicoccus sciuri]KTT84210.1 PTS sorbitol transporter subunit IIA [Mammaliicoccus sciuri]MBA1395786.1 PTS sorbitol transporter subunit IIA [Mammaliicoccus sciuri]MBF0720590.1 PTS glucitol/sorbitol transporter subunit IIA [Mammaliicoccus sciuri]MBG9205690.1 PTS glucitol/sorbitol transporter subunit IIA [Mammaliicoccus sciuri]MBG9209220.1 PTS glucitol/sorbitol transporter subunit IIA [Mammaliicoccus sciuri]
MYQTEIKKIGKDANAFEAEKMIILFGDNAPDELVDFCYIIDINQVENEITESNKLVIDGTEYGITKVGSAVNKNLNDLGHITLKFDGSTNAEQSGSLYLEDKPLVSLQVGSKIEII